MCLPRWNAFATVYVALSLCVLAASSSALLGGYVYDDQILPSHPMLDGWDDVALAFVRNSQDYLAGASGGGAKGVTYRPLPMASFALTQAIVGSVPFVHHLVSLSFHLIALWFLTLCASAIEHSKQLSPRSILVLTVFALHPAGVEAYGWINGRSDAMAGAVLCAVAYWLHAEKTRGLGLILLCALGCLCKETFLVSSLALLVGFELTCERKVNRSSLRLAGAWLAGALVFFVMRAQTPSSGSSGLGMKSVLAALSGAPRLGSLAAETVLLPRPSPMRLLASALCAPMSPGEMLAVLCTGLVVARLAWRKRWRAALLIGGALATLLPAGLISSGFWLGFERYLYMPLALLCVATFAPQSQASGRSGLVWLSAPFAMYLAWATYQAGTFYASPTVFAESMARARPADPTGQLFLVQLAAGRGDAAELRKLARSLPTDNLPPALLTRVIQVTLNWGDPARARALIEEGRRRFPDDPRFLRYAASP